MDLYFSIALGGAVGALARYKISVFFTSHYLSAIPWGTIFANILGSFLMGVLFVVFQEKLQQYETMRGLLTVGFLGAMTTFSSFSLEALIMLQKGDYQSAFGYIIGSVGLCLLAALVGVQVTRSWI